MPSDPEQTLQVLNVVFRDLYLCLKKYVIWGHVFHSKFKAGKQFWAKYYTSELRILEYC
jgi:hypothetical protein